MTKVIKYLKRSIQPLLIISSVLLTITVYRLPNQIVESMNIPAKDTLTIVKAERLHSKGDFIYMKGETTGIGKRINSSWEYNPEYPQEFWDGVLTLCFSNGGAKYYIWSKEQLPAAQTLDGWFYTTNNEWVLYGTTEVLNVLIPIVERNND